MSAGVSRRLGLALSAAVAGVILLAGCGSSKGSAGSGGAGVGGKAAGGAIGSGGAPAAGGAGGTVLGTGGAPAAGGATALGGAAGGALGTGGATPAGGSAGYGGTGMGGASISTGRPIVVPVSTIGPDRFYGVATDAAGNIFATGQVASSTDAAADVATVVAKFRPTGELDPTFGTGGIVTRNISVGTNGELFRGIVVQSTGKIVIAGTVEHAGAADARDRDVAVARFNADGSKDASFGVDGIIVFNFSEGVVAGTGFSADSAWGLARYPDDRLVVSGGQVRTGGTDTDFALLRLSADGLRDSGFGTNGLFSLDLPPVGGTGSNNASPRDVTILPGNEGIVGAGYQSLPGHNSSPVVFKVTDNGVLDLSFGTGGAFTMPVLAEQTECYAAMVQPSPTGIGYKLVTTGYGKA
ncbi:MAG TPA: hypothetical protein VHU40_07925, partial [Polyangia bacterium]|nr:hypothetical protein [Polyangia bacterium]